MLTLSISIERYCSVCHSTCHFRAKPLLLPVPVVLAFIYNIPKFFELRSEKLYENLHMVQATNIDNQTLLQANISYEDRLSILSNYTQQVSRTIIVGTEIRRNPWYIIIYVFWSNFLVVKMVPYLCMVVMNILIWRKIQEFAKVRRTALGINEGNINVNHQEFSITYLIFIRYHYIKMMIIHYYYGNFTGTLREARILISIVAVFIFCQSFTIVADAYEAFTCPYEKMRRSMCPSNPTIENIIDFSHFALTINSSINFALYVIHEKTFKEAIVKVRLLGLCSLAKVFLFHNSM